MAPPQASSQGSDDGMEMLLAIRAAQLVEVLTSTFLSHTRYQEKSSRAALEKKKQTLLLVQQSSDKYRQGVERDVRQYQSVVIMEAKKMQAMEKETREELELCQKTFQGLVRGMQESSDAFANSVLKEGDEMERDISVILKNMVEIHQAEGEALDDTNGLLWGGADGGVEA